MSIKLINHKCYVNTKIRQSGIPHKIFSWLWLTDSLFFACVDRQQGNFMFPNHLSNPASNNQVIHLFIHLSMTIQNISVEIMLYSCDKYSQYFKFPSFSLIHKIYVHRQWQIYTYIFKYKLEIVDQWSTRIPPPHRRGWHCSKSQGSHFESDIADNR